jgi:hypothetical protein
MAGRMTKATNDRGDKERRSNWVLSIASRPATVFTIKNIIYIILIFSRIFGVNSLAA